MCVFLAGAAIVAWLSLASLEPIVRGEGPAGQSITVTGPTPSGDRDLDILGRSERSGLEVECTGQGPELQVHEEFGSSQVEVEGETLLKVGETRSTWKPGDVVPACVGEGLDSVVVVEDPRPERRFFAGFGFGAVFFAVWTAIVFAVARSTPRPSRAAQAAVEDRRNP